MCDKTNRDNTIKFAKIKKGATIPTKRDEDGCYDIYACIDEYLPIPPCSTVLVPTGICSAFDNKYRISLRERGSNVKAQLKVSSGQIDSGYRGEWFVALFNYTDAYIILAPEGADDDLSNGHVILKDGLQNVKIVKTEKAICQAAVEFVPNVTIEEVSHDDILSINSERGTGALGSSGK